MSSVGRGCSRIAASASAAARRKGLPRSLGAVVAALACLVGAEACVKVMDDGSSTTGGATSALTREEHGMYFPIGLGSYHPTETCNDCHGGFSDFKQYTCQSCHAHAPDVAIARHTFITDFENLSSSCYKCHPNGREAEIKVADHSAKYFPINVPPHDKLMCTDCHGWTTTSRPFTCVSCHDHDPDPTNLKHANVKGYRFDSNGCYGCHPTAGIELIPTAGK